MDDIAKPCAFCERDFGASGFLFSNRPVGRLNGGGVAICSACVDQFHAALEAGRADARAVAVAAE